MGEPKGGPAISAFAAQRPGAKRRGRVPCLAGVCFFSRDLARPQTSGAGATPAPDLIRHQIMPPSRLRIAIVAACPFPWPRGTPTRILGLSRAMGRRGHDVHVVTYHLGKSTDDETSFAVHRTRRITWYRRVAPGPSYLKMIVMNPLLVRSLRRTLHDSEFDLIHAHHYEGLLVALGSNSESLPIIYDAHTTLASELPSYGLGLPGVVKHGIGRLLDRTVPGFADHTIAVSESIRSYLIEIAAADPDRTDVVGNGVDIAPFQALERDVGGGRGSETVVYAGNLAPYQRIDLLLDAFAELKDLRKSSRLLIATQDSFQEYERHARSLGVRDSIEVVTSGFEELLELLARADVAVNPRVVCDGVPQKNFNYMASSLPVVSFRSSSEPSVHGKTGLAVPDGDTTGLAKALLKLLTDEDARHRMGRAARTHVEEFSWRSRAEEVESIYRNVLERSGSRPASSHASLHEPRRTAGKTGARAPVSGATGRL